MFLGIGVGIAFSYLLKDIFLTNEYVEDTHELKLKQAIVSAKQVIEEKGSILKSSDIHFPKVNEAYAVIKNEERGFSKDLIWGDHTSALDVAIGQYRKSGIPGQKKPLLVAGHNGTHFKLLPTFQKGDKVKIETSYGTYVYEVYDMKTMHKSEFRASELEKNEEILIMYTCYPFHVITTDYRYFVYAKYIDGPQFEEDGSWAN